MDIKDSFNYWFSRKNGRLLRQFNWFRETAKWRLVTFSQFLLWTPVFLRLISILGYGWIFSSLGKLITPSSFENAMDYKQVTEDRISGIWARHLFFFIWNVLAHYLMPSILNRIL